MNPYSAQILSFFDALTMDSDRGGVHDYKSLLRSTVSAFLDRPDKERAFEVYSMFFDCYRVKLQGSASFIDLLDTLKSYEENAATLLDKQRDHYVHSVNVFLLGLAVYAVNPRYREVFRTASYEAMPYAGRRSTPGEEFLFQWGVAALFHDIGYPVEITSNQVKKFVSLVSGEAGRTDVGPYVGYQHFDALNRIAEVLYPEDYSAPFWAMTRLEPGALDPFAPLDLLSANLSMAFGVDLSAVKSALDGFLPAMQKSGFVDHGFYSALILLKWYGYLAQRSGAGTALLFGPILSAAGAILLHNYYKNVLQKPPFSLGLLEPEQHPLGFLLILCDELQEWNREAYGILDRQRVLAADSVLTLTEDLLSVRYLTYEGTLSPDFGPRKEEMFSRLLDLKAVFPQGIRITCTTRTDLYIAAIRRADGALVPRPLLENLEQLARTIHENYNRTQLERHPEQPLAYPTWEELPDDLKYSNIRQARAMFDKLTACGYAAGEPGGENEVAGFTPEQVESLARDEHDSWYAERRQSGWSFGPEKDVEHKLSPYMIPYDGLTEEIKELDRDAVRNVFPLIHSIGMAIYHAG